MNAVLLIYIMGKGKLRHERWILSMPRFRIQKIDFPTIPNDKVHLWYIPVSAFQVFRHLISGQLRLECNSEHSPFPSEIPCHRARVCFLWLRQALWKKLFCRLTDRAGHGVLRNGASPSGPLPGICPKSMKLSRICSRQMWIIYAPPFHLGVCLHENKRMQDFRCGRRWWGSCELLERPGPGPGCTLESLLWMYHLGWIKKRLPWFHVWR